MNTDRIKADYDRDYKDRKFGGPSYTHRWILKILNPQKGRRFLDIGCSQGYLLAEAEKLGLLAHGIDISQEAVKLARKNASSSEILCGDAHTLGWKDGYFDYITNIGSLEHFARPAECLREIRRVLKDDGRICVMLPNLYYYRNLINNLLYRRKPTSYQTIERFASLRVWKRFVEDGGFKIERIRKYNKFNRPGWQVFLRSVFIPLGLSHHFVFICRKESDTSEVAAPTCPPKPWRREEGADSSEVAARRRRASAVNV